MKKPLLLMPLACFLLLAATSQARLYETVEQIEARYGKAVKSVKPEFTATAARVYQKNGFRITVGFHNNGSCYEQFQKVDPKNPNAVLEISEAERDSLLQLNCNGCSGRAHAQETFSPDGRSYYLTTYKLSNELVTAVYDGDKKVFTIRSLIVDTENAEVEKKRQRENLKDF
jgi:hypothetical protein